MYFAAIFSPLLGFFILFFFGFFFGRRLSIFFSILCMFFSFIFSWFIFYEVIFSSNSVVIELFNWMLFNSFEIKLGFFFDTLTSIMLCVITIISFFVHLFSKGYMLADKRIILFFSYLSLFTFFMLLLVTSNNFLQMFIGWEGVGLCSYLLICFWYTRILAIKLLWKLWLWIG